MLERGKTAPMQILKSLRPTPDSSRISSNLTIARPAPGVGHESRRHLSDQHLFVDGAGRGHAGLWRRDALSIGADSAHVGTGALVQRAPTAVAAAGAGHELIGNRGIVPGER